jgi:uncharacterized protein
MRDKLIQSVGNIVTGERFWGRETELELLTNKIDEGANIMLVAQRRIGKTSVLAELYNRLSTRYTCLFVDLESAMNVPDAIAKLSIAMHNYKPLSAKTREVFENIIKSVTSSIEKIEAFDFGTTFRAGLTTGDWTIKADRLFEILGESEKPVIIMFDEMPIMLNHILRNKDFQMIPEGREEVAKFLLWLRDNCFKYQGKVHIMIAGSIGLEPILRKTNLSGAINHLMSFELEPWDETVSMQCIKALANQYKIELKDGVPNAMVKKLGCCIPHHIQMFFSLVRDNCKKRGKMECDLKDVEEVFERDMLGSHGHPELMHYEERLEMVLGKEMFAFAIEMLTEAAVSGSLTKEAIKALQKEYSFKKSDIVEIQKEILWVLEHDGYFRKTKDGYVFVSNLLKQWWKNRHEISFIPVLQRGN